ncbi:transmembrane protein 72 isoform X2 [Kryptolebias marmoratus]|uniref:Transmembrane protein 72 n=1 Tax=Kryptolebias marmoratus TaxID=37003 RepID=A0A3Q3BCZ2_KRYMA|nr:transmembrane protein 72 isoform X2 [Kryptolebias marmoratus]
MGNSESMWWILVESTCRILGVSTAIVLCAVGVETVQQGEFNSLGIYLLCPPNWQVFVLWGKMAHVGGFHKFLYYSIMSVVCFLHPVLVWHAIIPGSMLLMTALFNFVLSKKKKTKSKSPLESNSNQGPTTICVTDRSNSQSTFSVFETGTGRRGEGLAVSDTVHSFSPEEREGIQAMLGRALTASPEGSDRRKRWKERKLTWFKRGVEPVEREMEEIDDETEPDTTSDTAPMITD